MKIPACNPHLAQIAGHVASGLLIRGTNMPEPHIVAHQAVAIAVEIVKASPPPLDNAVVQNARVLLARLHGRDHDILRALFIDFGVSPDGAAREWTK
jgi:hypothetical protein